MKTETTTETQPITHTPSPWIIDEDNVITSDGDYVVGLEFLDHDIDDPNDAPLRELDQANTALILAAPDLLAALEGMVTACETDASLDSAAKTARAAIAAARKKP